MRHQIWKHCSDRKRAKKIPGFLHRHGSARSSVEERIDPPMQIIQDRGNGMM